jgi:hypothetical protein
LSFVQPHHDELLIGIGQAAFANRPYTLARIDRDAVVEFGVDHLRHLEADSCGIHDLCYRQVVMGILMERKGVPGPQNLMQKSPARKPFENDGGSRSAKAGGHDPCRRIDALFPNSSGVILE